MRGLVAVGVLDVHTGLHLPHAVLPRRVVFVVPVDHDLMLEVQRAQPLVAAKWEGRGESRQTREGRDVSWRVGAETRTSRARPSPSQSE